MDTWKKSLAIIAAECEYSCFEKVAREKAAELLHSVQWKARIISPSNLQNGTQPTDFLDSILETLYKPRRFIEGCPFNLLGSIVTGIGKDFLFN